MGIVCVACLAARGLGVLRHDDIKLERTSSAARVWSLRAYPSAVSGDSITTFGPRRNRRRHQQSPWRKGLSQGGLEDHRAPAR